MARLEAFLLGPPRVEVDGQPLEVDTRKATALLAYLAVTGHRASRDALATLFWPEYEADRARAALRRTLSTLNKALGGRWLAVERTAVGLERDGLSLDVVEFRQALQEGRLEQAVELYRGDFLAGFGLRDSVAFDDWQLLESQRLRSELADALARLARRCAERGALNDAIGHARRWLSLEPLAEAAHRLLIELQAQSGDRAAALRQYRECVRILHRELGVGPLEETTALYESVREGRLAVAAPPSDAPAPSVVAPPAHRLVGRATELDDLRGALQETAKDGRLVGIEGEAGIGKSRLVEELARGAGARGAAVLSIRCNEGEEGIAYGLAADVLRAAASARRLASLDRRWLTEAARLLPELVDGGLADAPSSSLDGAGAQTRFLDGVTQAIAASSDVLVVDDAHWADEASLDVLAYLARRLHGRRFLLVLTWRTEDVPPGHRLRRVVAEQERSGAARLLTLSRLKREDVAELVRDSGAGDVAERLYRETGGLPLFVVEYLAALAEGGGEWSLPGGIAELLRARLASLSETARQVLAGAAVLGGRFDLGVARAVSGRSEEETVAAVEELTGRGLLEEDSDGYSFSHEKLRDLVYEDVSLARRRLLHRRAAEELQARSSRDGASAALVAGHFQRAGEDGRAAEHHRIAGEHARSLFANTEALAHFEAAVALGHPDTSELHEAIGDLHTLLGDYGAAVASYETAAAVGGGERAAAIEHKLGGVHHRRGDWELAASCFDAAAALADGEDAGWRARLEADRSLNEHRRRRPEQAHELASRALDLAEAAQDTTALAQAHNILGVLASGRGDTAEARRQLEQSLALARVLPDPSARVAALNNLALVARADADLDGALELTREALGLCVLQGDRHREAAIRNNLADLLHAAGRGEEAMTELKQAVAIFAEIGGEPSTAQAAIWKLVDW